MEEWIDPKLSEQETESKLVSEKRALSRFINVVTAEITAFTGNGKTARRADVLAAYEVKIRNKNEFIQNLVESALSRRLWKVEDTKRG